MSLITLTKSDTAPLVEILLPVFNAETHIDECISSLLAQSYENFVFTILDDCSTDKTKEILRSFQLSDSRVNVVTNTKNLGIIESRNRLIEKSSAPYLAFMDADDICSPNRLKKQLEYLQQNEAIAAVTCWYQRFGNQNDTVRTPTNSEEIAVALFLDNVVSNPGVMIRRDVLIESNIKCDPKYRGAADYKMWVDLTSRYNMSCIPEVLLQYRTHASQESQQNNARQRKAHFAIVEHQFSKLGITLEGSDVAPLIWPAECKVDELTGLGKWISQISKELQHSSNPNADGVLEFTDIRFRSCCRRFGPNGLKAYINTRGIRALVSGRKFGISFITSCLKTTT